MNLGSSELPGSNRSRCSPRAPTLGPLEGCLLSAVHNATPNATATTVRYTSLRSAVGTLYIAATARGISNLGMGRTERAFGREIARQHRAAVVRDDAGLAPLRRALQAYLNGERRRFDARLDLRRLTAFQRRVLQETARIPPGRLRSYGDIAERIGKPGAARAVGQALGANPIPILIPCHRVVAQDGPGGFTGGLRLKRALLALEGVRL